MIRIVRYLSNLYQVKNRDEECAMNSDLYMADGPASNEASTQRFSTRAKPNKSMLHSARIGELLCSQVNPCSKKNYLRYRVPNGQPIESSQLVDLEQFH